MQIDRLKLVNFKNYPAFNVDFHPRLNLILGNNGVGKTNILDALYYLAFGKSYYAIPDRKLILFGAIKGPDCFFRVEASTADTDRFEVTYSPDRGKTISRNDVEYERISDHIGEIPLVSIFPEDIYLIRHGSALRRKFVNGTIGQLDRAYLNALLKYNQVLRQKNELLKNRRISFSDKTILLDKYDHDLIPLIRTIEQGRADFTKDFDPLFSAYYRKIVQEKTESARVVYDRSFQSDDIGKELKSCRHVDMEKARSSVGPHKDDFKILLNDQPARYFASQGQQKSILFSLKLAQNAYIKGVLKRSPVLLLDDFFEKLDQRRIHHVMAILASEHSGQIFVTDTDRERMIHMAESAGLEYKTIPISGI